MVDSRAQGEEISAVAPTCIVRTKDDRVVLDALTSSVANPKSLELRNFNLDDLNAQQLDTLLGDCRQDFQSLSLEKCTLSGDKFFTMLMERLTMYRVRLIHFRVKSCQQVTMTSLIAISTLFTPTLVTLELSSCKLPRQAGIILSQSLQACTSLRHLFLADNNIRDGGLRAIADALKLLQLSGGKTTVFGPEDTSSAPLLEQLDISRNGITSAGFTSLMQLPLRCLSVTGNSIESGVGALLLSNSSTLEMICLMGNPLSEDGKLDLVRSLFRRREKAGKSALRELDLRACGFDTIEGMELLQRSFQQAATAGQQCSLQTLYLDESAIPVDDEDEGDSRAYSESCDSLKQIAKTNFPSLRLRFQGDSIHMEPKPTQEVRPAQKAREADAVRSPSDKIETVSTLAAKLGLGTEIEAVAMATKTTLNATLASVAGLPVSPLSGSQQQILPAEYPRPDPVYLRPDTPDSLRTTPLMVQAHPLQQTHSVMANSSTMRAEPMVQLPVQHVDVDYIVSKTIECMSHNFELRLGQLLSRMETQQQERNSSQVQFLAAKVEACERALPRLEARLDMLTDRIAGGNAQLAKLQTDVALQLQQFRQEVLTQQVSNSYSSSGTYSSSQPSPTMPLSSRMKSQVEEMVANRVQATEQRVYSELDRVRSAQANPTPTDPHSVVNAVSAHLTQFKREFDANQTNVLHQFTENVNVDSRRLEDRVAHVESQIVNLESVIQSEQQASLLALEAISDAFNGPAASTARKV